MPSSEIHESGAVSTVLSRRKYRRISYRSVLDSAHNAEIKALEPRLAIETEALQANLDEVAKPKPRAKKGTP